MYLYTEQWELAEAMAHNLIDLYSLEPNLNEVFLKESTETIWQLKSGVAPRNTQEANQLVIRFIPGQKYALTQDLLGSFEKGDLRYTNWVGRLSNSDHTSTLYFPHKYKAILTETERLEYSIQFRVAEQYLIRAEARAQRGDIAGAQKDINVLRIRAGLPNTTASNLSELMDAILQERRVELFAEQGHRWFDLKRTGNANAILNALKPNWKVTDVLFPIPEAELQFNPNLLPQNNGYSN
ncbi:MAG: RagB/SusD family nutrient uptake outer membrane protein [Gelidibacter sp.]